MSCGASATGSRGCDGHRSSATPSPARRSRPSRAATSCRGSSPRRSPPRYASWPAASAAPNVTDRSPHMDYTEIRYEVADGVLTITLDRPDRLNAWTPTMQAELIDAFDRADADDDVRAIAMTGSGRAYCAGADLERGGGAL